MRKHKPSEAVSRGRRKTNFVSILEEYQKLRKLNYYMTDLIVDINLMAEK